MSLHVSTVTAISPVGIVAPPLDAEHSSGPARHSELLASLRIHSWTIDLKTERVRWETVDGNGRTVVIKATLTDLLKGANDDDAGKFRAHLKQAIDTGSAGPDHFRFDDLDHSASEIESVCVLKWLSGHPVVIGLYRNCEKERRQSAMIQALRTSLDTLIAQSTSCMIVLARDGTILNCNQAFLKFLNARDKRAIIRQSVFDLASSLSDRLEAIIRGALLSNETLAGHGIMTFHAGQVRDVRWKAFGLEFLRAEAATRVFSFDLRRVDGEDVLD